MKLRGRGATSPTQLPGPIAQLPGKADPLPGRKTRSTQPPNPKSAKFQVFLSGSKEFWKSRETPKEHSQASPQKREILKEFYFHPGTGKRSLTFSHQGIVQLLEVVLPRNLPRRTHPPPHRQAGGASRRTGFPSAPAPQDRRSPCALLRETGVRWGDTGCSGPGSSGTGIQGTGGP